MLLAQLEEAEPITARRRSKWELYHQLLQPLEEQDYLRRPIVPEGCVHNAHIYYILLPTPERRASVKEALYNNGIQAASHYAALHLSPGGKKFGRCEGECLVSQHTAEVLLRLPLWPQMEHSDVALVVHVLTSALLPM